MSNDLELFKNHSLMSGGLFDRFMESTKRMAGGTGRSGRRISIRGGRFRLIVDGEQISVSKEDTMNMIVIDASELSRTYYEGTYDPENPAPPACWSADAKVPSPDVPEETRQASRCADCPMNVKGSGQGNSRACRYSQRLAVMLEGDLDKVYQLQLPATSIFGSGEGKKLPLQAYIKHLSEHGTPVQAVVTTMQFDEDSETPRLSFRPARMANEEEITALSEHHGGAEVTAAITMTVASQDAKPKPKPKPEKKAAPVDTADDEGDDEEVIDEPKKATKKGKAATTSTEKKSTADLMSEWDD